MRNMHRDHKNQDPQFYFLQLKEKSTNIHQSCSKCTLGSSNDIPLNVYVQAVCHLLQHMHDDAHAIA